MREDALFAGALFEQPSLFKRLLGEFREASLEFCADPRAYIAGVVRDDHLGSHRRKSLFRLGLAIGLFVYSILFVVTLIFWAVNARPPMAVEKGLSDIVINFPQFMPSNPALPLSDKRAQGGGGGGGEETTPATRGLPPLFSRDPLIIAPTTRPPLQPPLLAVNEHLLGDASMNVRRDHLIPTGVPEGVIAPPSDGQGTNKGIGIGDDGGVGSGKGPGTGPGKNGGTGGGEYSDGGRIGRPEAAQSVEMRPVPLNRPRPNYTEEARKNKVQGVVRARILVGADGAVRQVKIVGTGLPDGLNEEAIRAAYQMRFRPALKNGQPVAHWISLEIEFNLR